MNLALVQFKEVVVGGENVIDGWLKAQPEEIQADFLSMLEQFEKVPLEYWPNLSKKMKGDKRGYRAKLRGDKYKELRELQLDKRGKAYRLAAYRGPGANDMTLLSGWIHDSDAAQEVGLEQALERRELVRQGKVKVVDRGI